MGAKFTNFAETEVEELFAVAATSLVVSDGDVLPTLGVGDYCFLTIFDGENEPELVKATARSGQTLTVERAAEGSNSREWDVGSKVRLALTAEQAEDALASIDDHETRIAALEVVDTSVSNAGFQFCHSFLARR